MSICPTNWIGPTQGQKKILTRVGLREHAMSSELQHKQTYLIGMIGLTGGFSQAISGTSRTLVRVVSPPKLQKVSWSAVTCKSGQSSYLQHMPFKIRWLIYTHFPGQHWKVLILLTLDSSILVNSPRDRSSDATTLGIHGPEPCDWSCRFKSFAIFWNLDIMRNDVKPSWMNWLSIDNLY